jgi:hypothetical protein
MENYESHRPCSSSEAMVDGKRGDGGEEIESSRSCQLLLLVMLSGQ